MIRLHATAVAIGGRAVLLLGRPGSGKSDLALRLIDRGAVLVSDDQVDISITPAGLIACAPATIAGQIEVRGVGIIALPYCTAPVAMAFDLEMRPDRLPEPATRDVAGIALPCLPLAPFDASAPLKVEAALRAL